MSRQRLTHSSFATAWQGLSSAVRTELNLRRELVIALAVVIIGLYFQLAALEWAVVILLCGLVFVAELINTAIEHLLDIVHPRLAPQAGLIKEIMAGAVLSSAFLASVGGLCIFGPYFLALLK